MEEPVIIELDQEGRGEITVAEEVPYNGYVGADSDSFEKISCFTAKQFRIATTLPLSNSEKVTVPDYVESVDKDVDWYLFSEYELTDDNNDWASWNMVVCPDTDYHKLARPLQVNEKFQFRLYSIEGPCRFEGGHIELCFALSEFADESA